MKIPNRILLLIIYLSSFSIASLAQQSWGISSSNYAGVSNVDLNPSNIVLSKYAWDVNVAGFDAGFLNNSFYTNPQFVFPNLFNKDLKISTSNNGNAEKINKADVVIRDNVQNNTFLNASVNIKGPSFMITRGDNSFAFSTSFRGGVAAYNIPQPLVKLAYEQLKYPSLFNQVFSINKGTSAAAMAWMEFGGTYSRIISNSSTYLFAAGTTLKYLTGYAGGYGISNGIDFMVPYTANFTAINLNMGYGHAVFSESTPVSIFNPLGSGISADFGITIMKKRESKNGIYYGCPSMIKKSYLTNFGRGYRWKLGISLIDLGGINFKYRSSAYTYSDVNYSWDKINRINAKTLDDVDLLFINHFVSSGNNQYQTNFFVWAPTAASAQFDYNFNNLYYANASIIQRIVFTSDARLARMNSIVLIPRIETEEYEISLPIIINEYMYPNLGLMVRYRYFFIGSDQLGSTLGMTSLYGFNLYAGIKINFSGRIGKEPKMEF